MLPSHVLAGAVGLRLERADVQWHVSPGQEDSLMRFWLTFGGVSYGFHVGAEDEILDVIVEERGTDADMGVYGRLEVRPAAGTDPAAFGVGQRLVAVHDLFAGYLGKPIGARLSFETVDLSVADWEDELHWAAGDLPREVGVRQR